VQNRPVHEQSPLLQSAPAVQSLVAAQGAQEPPQFTSVSSESLVPLVQWVGVVQTFDVHVPLVQSAFAPHGNVAPHFLAQEPAQSMACSVPFFTPSVHVGAWHESVQKRPVQEHTPLVQSAAAPHFFVSAHFAQVPPPQSTSVSLPVIFVSVH